MLLGCGANLKDDRIVADATLSIPDIKDLDASCYSANMKPIVNTVNVRERKVDGDLTNVYVDARYALEGPCHVRMEAGHWKATIQMIYQKIDGKFQLRELIVKDNARDNEQK